MLLARFFSVTISKVMIINKQANCSPSSYKVKKKKQLIIVTYRKTKFRKKKRMFTNVTEVNN